MRNCDALVSVTLGDGLTTIDEYAFDGCVALEHIVIPDSVTHINEGAFEYCDNLSSFVDR